MTNYLNMLNRQIVIEQKQCATLEMYPERKLYREGRLSGLELARDIFQEFVEPLIQDIKELQEDDNVEKKVEDDSDG